MDESTSGKYELRLSGNPAQAGGAPRSAWGLRQVFDILLLTPGIILCLLAQNFYPPLDGRASMGWMLGLFLTPVALQVLGAVIKRPAADSQFWPIVYRSSSAALVALALILFLNGGLDHSPASSMTATVVKKSAYHGRRADNYTLVVTSWRPGKGVEYFGVGESVYERARVGLTITVPVHRGAFGLAWHGPITPE